MTWTSARRVPVAIAVLVFLSLAPTAVGASGAGKSKTGVVRACELSALRVSVQNGDGLHHGVEFISFLNLSGTACTLSGYPKVDAVLDSTAGPSRLKAMYAPSPAHALKTATDVEWAWAGGVDVNDVPPKTFVAPTITLAARSGEATATLNWVDGPNGDATCPAFNDLIIRVGGRSVTRFVNKYELLCYEFAVTPIVAGKTGTMFVRADFSKKANDLALAKDGAANLSQSTRELHHELVTAGKYSFYQKLTAASYLRDASQGSVQRTPWPKVNAYMSVVSREAEAYGAAATVSLMHSGYSRTVRTDYLRLRASLSELRQELAQLSP